MLCLVVCGLGTSCTNRPNNFAARSTTNPENLFPGDGDSGVMTISNVLRSDAGLGSVATVMGDGSGAMGLNCATSSGSDIGCRCHITYMRENGATEEVDVAPIYFETDMMRCPLDAIPSDAKSADIRIHGTTAGGDDFYTNAFSMSLDTPGDSDPKSLANFLRVHRTQCRDIVSINYTFGGSGMYDPALSKSPLIAHTTNYFSTNVGGHLMNWSQGDIKKSRGFECQSTLDMDAFGNSLLFFTPPLRTTTGLPAGNIIEPNFFLARTPAGSFVKPLNTWTNPGTSKLIGYAAKSISTNGKVGIEGTESCPTETLPPGKKMVKVWLFRALMPKKKHIFLPEYTDPTPGTTSYTPTQILAAYNQDNAPINSATHFPTCLAEVSGSRTSTPTQTDYYLIKKNAALSDPVNYCAAKHTATSNYTGLSNSLGYTGIASQLAPLPYLSQSSQIIDLWYASFCGSVQLPPSPPPPAPQNPIYLFNSFAMRLCTNLATGASHGDGTPTSPQAPFAITQTSGGDVNSFIIPGTENRFDYIYLTTPDAFHTKDWQSADKPKRWVGYDKRTTPEVLKLCHPLEGDPGYAQCITDNSCESNPDACKLVEYELKLGDPVRSAGDINEKEGPQFPVCAIQ